MKNFDKVLTEIFDEFEIKYKHLNRFKEFRGKHLKAVMNVGDCNNEIWIEKSLSEREKDISLIHEIIHAYRDYRGLEQIEKEIEREAVLIYEKSRKRRKNL